MTKRPFRITLISICGFLIGLFNIFSFSNRNDLIFLIIGLICVFLSLAIFRLWKPTRIIAMIFSWIFILIYLSLIIYAVTGYSYHHGFAFIGLIFHLPLLLLCILTLHYFNLPQIKKLFSNNTQIK